MSYIFSNEKNMVTERERDRQTDTQTQILDERKSVIKIRQLEIGC
jgi:hypothetical protein